MKSQTDRDLILTRTISILTLLVVITGSVFAQGSGGVDLTFNANPALDAGPSILAGSAVAEPDGKMITLIRFDLSGSNQSSVVNRVNADGSIDPSFNCTSCSWNITSIARQPSGKILIAGSDGPSTRIGRLNPDGSADFTFVSPYEPTSGSFSSSAEIFAVAPDGKIYVARRFVGFHLSSRVLHRLNIDGSIDSTFTSSNYDTWNTNYRLLRVEVLPSGKLLITGKHGEYGKLFRLNNDGTRDTSLDPPVVSGPFTPGFPIPINEAAINAGVQQADGKVVFAGPFDGVNALPKLSVARLNVDSSVDSTPFGVSIAGIGGDLRGQSDGKIVINANFTGSGYGFKRINPDLSEDTSFNFIPFAGTPDFWMIDNFNRIVIFTAGAFVRFNTDGTPDVTFNFSIRAPGKVTALAAQADGKVLVAGTFGFMGGAVRNGFARVNADGSNDASFDPGIGFDVTPHTLLVQPDGKILACGEFASYNGALRTKLIRINADGSPDFAFSPSVTNLTTIALQPDGKILLGGGSMMVNSISRTGVARLNPDGSTDQFFNPVMNATTISTLIVEPDGKIAFTGTFSGVNGFNRTNFARLKSDGTLDASLNAGNIGFANRAVRQPDGKYLLGANTVIRRNADGSADNSFAAPNFSGGGLSSMLLDPTGRVIVGGNFTSPGQKVFRLTSSGAHDPTFLPGGANAFVSSMVPQPNGKFIVGGEFTSIGGVSRPGIARVESVIVPRVRFDFDGDGRADVSLTQPGDFTWRQLLGINGTPNTVQFGLPGDKITPADYDGDGRTDIAVFDPPSGWWFKSSTDGQIYSVAFGQPGDVPLPGDINGDGKADFVIVRNYAWYALTFSGQLIMAVNFGQAGDKPITGDFDGDGKTDPAVYRPSTGQFIYAASANNGIHTVIRWGAPDDIPVPADYDGDGKTDAAVFRPSDGVWWVLFSRNMRYRGVPFGLGTDKPVPADYDGDGMADISVFRPSDGNWYFLKTAEGYTGIHFGTSTDMPTPAAFIPAQ